MWKEIESLCRRREERRERSLIERRIREKPIRSVIAELPELSLAQAPWLEFVPDEGKRLVPGTWGNVVIVSRKGKTVSVTLYGPPVWQLVFVYAVLVGFLLLSGALLWHSPDDHTGAVGGVVFLAVAVIDYTARRRERRRLFERVVSQLGLSSAAERQETERGQPPSDNTVELHGGRTVFRLKNRGLLSAGGVLVLVLYPGGIGTACWWAFNQLGEPWLLWAGGLLCALTLYAFRAIPCLFDRITVSADEITLEGTWRAPVCISIGSHGSARVQFVQSLAGLRSVTIDDGANRIRMHRLWQGLAHFAQLVEQLTKEGKLTREPDRYV